MEDSTGKFLNPLQRRIVAASLTLVAVVLIIWLVIRIFVAFQNLVALFSGVIWPLAMAGILALLLRPQVQLLEGKLRLSRVKAIVVLYSLVVLLFVGLLSLILPTIIIQCMELIEFLSQTDFQESIGKLRAKIPTALYNLIEQITENERLQEYLNGSLGSLDQVLAASLPAIKGTGAWFMGLFGMAVAAAIIPVYLFFFLETDADLTKELKEHLSFLKPVLVEDLLFLVREFANIMVAFFRGQLLIGLIMGILLAMGFSLVGLKFALFLGLMMGLLNIIPYLGTILGIASVLPIAYFDPDDGGLMLVGLCGLVIVVVQIVEGYLLTPRIMGKQTGLHPLTVIVSIFFWGTALGGLLGMILAIPLTAFFIIVWRLLRKKYLEPFWA